MAKNNNSPFILEEDTNPLKGEMYNENDPDIKLVCDIIGEKNLKQVKETNEESEYIKNVDNENEKDFAKLDSLPNHSTKRRAVQSARPIDKEKSAANLQMKQRNERNIPLRINSAREKDTAYHTLNRRQSENSLQDGNEFKVVGKPAHISPRAIHSRKKHKNFDKMTKSKKCIPKLNIKRPVTAIKQAVPAVQVNTHRSVSSLSSSPLGTSHSGLQEEENERIIEPLHQLHPINGEASDRDRPISMRPNTAQPNLRSNTALGHTMLIIGNNQIRPMSARNFERGRNQISQQWAPAYTITNQMPKSTTRKRPISAAISAQVQSTKERKTRIRFDNYDSNRNDLLWGRSCVNSPNTQFYSNQMPQYKIHKRPISAAINTHVMFERERNSRINPAKTREKYKMYLNELENQAKNCVINEEKPGQKNEKGLLNAAKKQNKAGKSAGPDKLTKTKK